MNAKYFLLALSMAINLRGASDERQCFSIERSRLLCLATLPLMFDDEDYREHVEEKISNVPDLA